MASARDRIADYLYQRRVALGTCVACLVAWPITVPILMGASFFVGPAVVIGLVSRMRTAALCCARAIVGARLCGPTGLSGPDLPCLLHTRCWRDLHRTVQQQIPQVKAQQLFAYEAGGSDRASCCTEGPTPWA